MHSWDGSQVPCCYLQLLLMWPSRLKSIEIKSHFCKSRQIIFQNYSSTTILEIISQLPLSQTTASSHPSVFTFTLPLPGGRVSDAWEPSNQRMLPLPHRSKVSLTSLMTSHFRLLFCYFPLTATRPPLGTTQSATQWVPWALSLGVKTNTTVLMEKLFNIFNARRIIWIKKTLKLR